MRIESITSAQNPKIKDLLALQEKSKERRKKGLFVVGDDANCCIASKQDMSHIPSSFARRYWQREILMKLAGNAIVLSSRFRSIFMIRWHTAEARRE